MKQDIGDINSKGENHGYQEWYGADGKMWLRGTWKNGQEIGYEECNDIGGKSLGEEGSEVKFYIR
jgi:hypothetical protein